MLCGTVDGRVCLVTVATSSTDVCVLRWVLSNERARDAVTALDCFQFQLGHSASTSASSASSASASKQLVLGRDSGQIEVYEMNSAYELPKLKCFFVCYTFWLWLWCW